MTERLHSLCDKRALTAPKAGSKPQLLQTAHVTSFGRMVRVAVVNDSEMKASFCIIPCGVGPKCIHKYLYKRKVKGNQTITREGHVRRRRRQNGIGYSHNPGTWRASEAGRGRNKILPRASTEAAVLLIP